MTNRPTERPEDSPWTLAEIRSALDEAHRRVASYFGGLPRDELYRREPGEWAPVDDLRHLTLSVSPVVRALETPVDDLRSRFGEADRASRSYGEVRDAYRAELDAGLTSPEPFVPGDREDEDPAELRERALARWESLGEALQDALDGWSEDEVDRVVLPHPALGPMTVREMLYFTHLHDLHHVRVARRRLSG